jgi:hypothetical protein
MVRYLFVLLVVMAFAAPAFAQDVPQLELGFGYGNFAMKDLFPNRSNGFTTRQTINLNSTFAIENYLGFYWFGSQPNFGKTELVSEHIGGRVSYRNLGPVFYGNASIGGGFLRFPQLGGGESSFGFKYGGGVDIPFKDFFAWNIDVSRMSYGFFGDFLDGRVGGLNISTGIVIKMGE